MTPTKEAPFMQRALLVVGLMLIAGVVLPAAEFTGSLGISLFKYPALGNEGSSSWITILWPLLVGIVMVALSFRPVTPTRAGVVLGLALIYPVTLGLSEYALDTTSQFPNAQAISKLPGWTLAFFLLGWILLLTGALARHFRPSNRAAQPVILVGAVSLGIFWLVPHPVAGDFIGDLIHFWPLIVGITMITLSRTTHDPIRSGAILVLILLYPLLISLQVLPGLVSLMALLPKIPTASWLHPALFLLGIGGLLTGGYALFCAPGKRLAAAISVLGAAALMAFWLIPISQFVPMPASQALGLFKSHTTLAQWLTAIMLLQMLAAITGILTTSNIFHRHGGKLNLASLGLTLASLVTLVAGALYGIHNFPLNTLGMDSSTVTSTLLSGALKEPLWMAAMLLAIPVALGNLLAGNHRNSFRASMLLAIGLLIVASQILPVSSLTRLADVMNPKLITTAPVIVHTWQLLNTIPTIGVGLLLFALIQFGAIALCIANPPLLNGGLPHSRSRLLRIAVPALLATVVLGFLIASVWPLSPVNGFLPATLLELFKNLLWTSGILLAIVLAGSYLFNDGDTASPTAWTAMTTFSWCALVFAALVNNSIPVFLPIVCFFLHLAAAQLWSAEMKPWLAPRGWPDAAMQIAAPFLLTFALVMCCLWPIMLTGENPERTIFLGFTHCTVIALLPLITFRWLQKSMGWSNRVWWMLATLAIIPTWQWLVAGTEWQGWFNLGPAIARGGLVMIFLAGMVWTIWWVDKKSRHCWIQRNRDLEETTETKPSPKEYSTTLSLALLTGPLGLDRFYTGHWRLGMFKAAWLLALAWWLVCTAISDTWCTSRLDPPVIKTWFAQFRGLEFFSTDTLQFAVHKVQALASSYWAGLGSAITQADASQADTTCLAMAAAFLLSAIFCLADIILLAIGRYRDANGLALRMRPVKAELSPRPFTKVCPLSIGLGWLGADRFYTGRWRLGLLKIAWLWIIGAWAIGMWRAHPAGVNEWFAELKVMAGFDLLFLGHLTDQLFGGIQFVVLEIPSRAMDGDLACQAVAAAFLWGAVHWAVDILQLFTRHFLDHDGRPIRLPELELERSPARYASVAWLATLLGFIGLHHFYTRRWKSGLLRLAIFAIIPLAVWGASRSNPHYLLNKLPPQQIRLMTLEQVGKTNWLDTLPENFTIPEGLHQMSATIARTSKAGTNEISRLLLKGLLKSAEDGEAPHDSPLAFTTNAGLSIKHGWVYDLLRNDRQLEMIHARATAFLSDTNNFGAQTNVFIPLAEATARLGTNLVDQPSVLAKAVFLGVVLNPSLRSDDEAWASFHEADRPAPRSEPLRFKLAELNPSSRQEIGQLLLTARAMSMTQALTKDERRWLGIPEEQLDDIVAIPIPDFWKDPKSVAMIKTLAQAGFNGGGWKDVIPGKIPALTGAMIRDAFTRGNHWAQLILFGMLACVLWVVDLVLLCMGRLRDSLGRQVRLEPVSVLRSPLESMNQAVAQPDHRVWNPLDLDAWYYGRTKQKLKQSLNACAQYSALFGLIVLLLMLLLSGCNELYEPPAGGGEPELKQKVIKQIIKIKEVPIVNPLSNLIRPVPPIEEILKNLLEETMHRYEVGQGQGKGAGFAGGTKRGKVRFIRLRYAGGDWDQDLDLNSDLNMLTWYAAHTGQNTARLPEVRTIGQLRGFPKDKSPPLVYMTGERSISISQREMEALREYLVDKHGMIFADNGGSSGWHSQFFSLMRRVLPNVNPRPIPIDHPVHSGLAAIPIVAPHGGRTAYGWVVESRIVAYYHPGDVGDAWADGHAGVPRKIWEASYRLGGNVILYAHSEYSKWLLSQKKKD